MLISLKYKIRAPPFSAHWALMYFAHVLRRPYLLLILLQILSLIVPPHLFPLSPSPQPLPVCQSGLSCEPKVECFWILIASCTSFPPPPHTLVIAGVTSDTLEHFTRGYLYSDRGTERLMCPSTLICVPLSSLCAGAGLCFVLYPSVLQLCWAQVLQRCSSALVGVKIDAVLCVSVQRSIVM